MYNLHLKIKQCSTGLGVFTNVEIPANVPIIEVTGELYSESELPDQNNPYILQVGSDKFIGPSGSTDDYINHSCNPNCLIHVVGNRAILYSMYVIPKGGELTFDYSTTSTDTLDKWKMICNCGLPNCRKVISGFQYLDQTLQEEYKKKGMIPLYLLYPNTFH